MNSMLKIIQNIILIVLLNCQFIYPLSIQENFFNENIIGYYLSAIDIETGESNLLLFDYSIMDIDSDFNSLEVDFQIFMNVPSLIGSEYSTSLQPLTTGKFYLTPPLGGSFPNEIHFRNTDLNLDTEFLPGGVNFNFNKNDYDVNISETEVSELTEIIMGQGRIPNGMYSFYFKVCNNELNQEICSDPIVKNIEIFVPTYLELIMPGTSILSDTLSNIVYSPYPVFQWNSDYCSQCNYSIRVCEFSSQRHSSLIEAIEDASVLPLSGSNYHEIESSNNIFQYPSTGVDILIEGKTYVWQIKRTFETTNGSNNELSPIFVFKMQSQDQNSSSQITSSSDINLENIKLLIGESNFSQLFSNGGILEGYINVSPLIELNNEEISINYLLDLIDMLNNGQINILDVEVE